MYKALVATEAPLNGDQIRGDLEEAGIEVVAESLEADGLAQSVLRAAPDFVIAASVSPSNHLFDAARTLGTLAPCPFIMFSSDGDADKIERASGSGIHAYIVNGYAKHRILSIVQVARARFRHEQILLEEFTGLTKRFEERKVVDRAKGALMRSRGIIENDAFDLLRSLAMRSRQRIGVVAQSVVDMARAGEAVNRAGQLRMLSQRIVKCYAQLIVDPLDSSPRHIISDCIARVDANIGILRKAISTKGFSGYVESVEFSWRQVAEICVVAPETILLDALDSAAEMMLRDSESLTRFLESSGLVASLHILNVAGRQRMLSQRISKLCFLLAIDPTPVRVEQLAELKTTFQTAMDYLCDVPLSSPPIRETLHVALNEWRRLENVLEQIAGTESLREISDTGDRLLDASERLADQYEQAMQLLIGDQVGQLG